MKFFYSEQFFFWRDSNNRLFELARILLAGSSF